MKTTAILKKRVMSLPRGKPFTTSHMARYGSRAAVDQALSRMVSEGRVTRITRGIYVRPVLNRFIGEVLPEPITVIKAIAQKTQEIIQVSGAEAARQLGLSTQVSTQPIYLTTGPSRSYNVGNIEVTLRHVSRKKIPFPNSKVGLAILALSYLGKNIVDTASITIIKRQLSSTEFKRFLSSREHMPIWLSDIVLKFSSCVGGNHE